MNATAPGAPETDLLAVGDQVEILVGMYAARRGVVIDRHIAGRVVNSLYRVEAPGCRYINLYRRGELRRLTADELAGEGRAK